MRDRKPRHSRKPEPDDSREAQKLPQIFLREFLRKPRSRPHLYLRLLLLTLLLEVSWVLASSHSLKFRSNTHRKGSLLKNN